MTVTDETTLAALRPPTKVWATKRSIRDGIADVPENWLYGFAANHPLDIRKYGDGRNSMLIFRVSAVLAAIEAGEWYKTSHGDGVVTTIESRAENFRHPQAQKGNQ